MAETADFGEFVEARSSALLRSAVLLCGERQSAEDLVQETFAKMYAIWGSRRLDNAAAYAHTTMVRTFISGRRRRSSSEMLLDALPEAPNQANAGADVALRLDLFAALSELAPIDRAVLVLRFLDDLDVASTGALLGLTPNAVRSRTTRALSRVREHIGDQTEFLGGVR